MNKIPNKHKRDQMRWDILMLMQITSDYGWQSVKKDSVHRILYLSGVLFHFVNDSESNPFSFYNFTRRGAGPYDSEIDKALDFLIKDEFIESSDSIEFISSEINVNDGTDLSSEALDRIKWLDLIIQILAIYGEDKIYEFIFRDKEFKELIATNAEKSLNIGPKNATIIFLETFRRDFDTLMKQELSQLGAETYLKLYFDYIFKKILERT